MKNIIIYAVIFIIAFVATTFTVFTYNSKYENMFEFDFRGKAEVALADSLAALDSLAISDSLHVPEVDVHAEKAKEYEEQYTETKVELDKTSTKLSNKEQELEHLKTQIEEKKTAEHEAWLKSTIKLYEAMELGKAGQLLKSLPEHEARELIYSMKNKKAAAILSNLDTETVKRLTRAKK